MMLRHTARRSFSSNRIQLARNKRSNIVFGANTDVGKTIVSAGLVRAALASPSCSAVHYIKPLQSGGSDRAFVERYNKHPSLHPQTLFTWTTPASPHLAASLENLPVSDQEVLGAVRSALADITSVEESSATIIETAGGVLSPSSASPLNSLPKHATDERHWGWMTQADLYQPLLGQLPVVLVGDGRLGGISATLSALESLIIRGYDVAAVAMIGGDDNLAAIRAYARRKVALRSGSGDTLLTSSSSMVCLPPIPEDPAIPLDDWYASDEVSEKFTRLDAFLQQSWEGQVADLQSMRREGSEVVWWPFTQHGNVDDDSKVTLIDSASGDDFHVVSNNQQGQLERQPMFDACASWWTQGMGHGESTMALAAAAAAGRYGHVIFPEVVHAPAVALSQKLVGPTGPGHGWASRVFFTDDGSTAVEVAIKMGLKLYQKRHQVDEDQVDQYDWVVCAQEDCYHGDTLGVMDVAEPSIFNEGQHPWYEPKGLFLPTPTLGFEDGILRVAFPDDEAPDGNEHTFDSIEQAMDVRARMLTSLFSHYKEVIEMQWLVYEHSGVNRKIGSLLIEPVLMGAGGMKFVDPLWQRALMEIARSRSVPIIFDEVASGLHRVGVSSCREILQADPDISCYAKLLTGGLLPLSVTLASEEVFDTFLGDEKGQALLHGHSYTAHPVGCVSALQALDAYHAVLDNQDTGPRMLFDSESTRALSQLPLVQRAFTLGTVLAVTIQPEDGVGGYAASSRTVPIVKALRAKGVFARPLGNVVYLMGSPLTSRDECTRLTRVLHETIQEFC